jgi:hypothetical protein
MKENELSGHDRLRELYLETVKRTVCGYNLMTEANSPAAGDDENLKTTPYDENSRLGGFDWPRFGFTMTGMARLNSVETILSQVYNL